MIHWPEKSPSHWNAQRWFWEGTKPSLVLVMVIYKVVCLGSILVYILLAPLLGCYYLFPSLSLFPLFFSLSSFLPSPPPLICLPTYLSMHMKYMIKKAYEAFPRSNFPSIYLISMDVFLWKHPLHNILKFIWTVLDFTAAVSSTHNRVLCLPSHCLLLLPTASPSPPLLMIT